jgi:hypothetical protein
MSKYSIFQVFIFLKSFLLLNMPVDQESKKQQYKIDNDNNKKTKIDDRKEIVRETWTGKFDFFLATLGYAGYLKI